VIFTLLTISKTQVFDIGSASMDCISFHPKTCVSGLKLSNLFLKKSHAWFIFKFKVSSRTASKLAQISNWVELSPISLAFSYQAIASGLRA